MVFRCRCLKMEVVAMVVVALLAACVVFAVPLDDPEARQVDGGAESNFTISGDELNEIVGEIADHLGIGDQEEPPQPSTTTPMPPTSKTPHLTIGNILYSSVGFLLGGLMLAVSLFDLTRKPVIEFFDGVFGTRQTRRRRDLNVGVESKVREAFHAFTAALDKMNAVLKVSEKYKK